MEMSRGVKGQFGAPRYSPEYESVQAEDIGSDWMYTLSAAVIRQACEDYYRICLADEKDPNYGQKKHLEHWFESTGFEFWSFKLDGRYLIEAIKDRKRRDIANGKKRGVFTGWGSNGREF